MCVWGGQKYPAVALVKLLEEPVDIAEEIFKEMEALLGKGRKIHQRDLLLEDVLRRVLRYRLELLFGLQSGFLEADMYI